MSQTIGKQSSNNQLALDNSERYCVFQSGGGWFGIPALAVKSVVPLPELTPIPQSDPILKGLCHHQNEFFPVVSLQALTQIQYETSPDSEQQLLIILGPQGPWGLLIDQAVSLADLEISISTFSNHHDQWSKVTLGSATFHNQVLQILDPTAIFEYALNLLSMYWQSAGTADHHLTSNQ
jgi:chemotaxis signal transduction protein